MEKFKVGYGEYLDCWNCGYPLYCGDDAIEDDNIYCSEHCCKQYHEHQAEKYRYRCARCFKEKKDNNDTWCDSCIESINKIYSKTVEVTE